MNGYPLVLPERALRFAETTTSQAIRSALDYAIVACRPARVIGPSGIGKSAAIAELLAGQEAVGFRITSGDVKVAGLYRLLLRVYDCPERTSYTLRELSDAVYYDLPDRDQAMPLIVDEYQNLEPLALRELLSVQEAAKLSLVLVGNGETIAQRNRVADQRAMEQIRNRFAMQVELADLLDSDFDAIADEWFVEQVAETRAAVANYGRLFSLHQLVEVLSHARRVSAIGTIRMEHLRATVDLLNRHRASIFAPKRAAK